MLRTAEDMNRTPSDNAKSANSTAKKTPQPMNGHKAPRITNDILLHAYRDMLRSRLCDDKIILLYKQNKCHFQIGVAGHEAVQVAAGHVFTPKHDWFYPYYRDMALCAAIGMTSEEFMLNAMNKQDDPSSHGRQMPMHYGHKGLNIVNQSSPTGTQFLQAVGCALSSVKLGLKEVTYVSAGEGTCAQGDFHEALNWASRDKLPVVFLIQNNDFAISVPVAEQLAGKSVYAIAQGYENLGTFEIDGTDYAKSREVLQQAYDRALRGEGPSLIEAHVPRLQSHSISDNHLKYRSAKDIENEKTRCPIALLRARLLAEKIITKDALEALEAELKAEVDQAAERADAKPDCNPDEALDNVYVSPEPWKDVQEGTPTGEDIYLVDALNHALDEELSRNKDVFIFGQDVAHGKGGVFTVTAGLTAKYGKDRVFNSQLAESSIAGVAVGMASRGLRPVAEIQFGDYVWTAMMQIRNELAMMYYRSGGDFTCPAVIRIPVGGYIHGGCYHSQNIEATFSHFPGLFIVYPGNASDAKGLLKAAIRGKDPVLFLEHKGLYRQVHAKGPEGDADCLVPLGKAKVVRSGERLTVVTWGALVNKCIVAANALAEEGINVEIIDLRTIVPFDKECVFESVRKTGRVLIAHEDVEFMGFGAEIAAQIADACFTSLDAPVKRLGMKNVAAVPHSPVLEVKILPQNDDVLRGMRDVLAF